MPAVLKARHGSEVYRVFIEGDLAYDSVVAAIDKVRPAGCRSACLVAKYLDDEGDLCTLCAATFDDFLACSGVAGAPSDGHPALTLKLQLCEQGRRPDEASAPVPAQPSAPASRRAAAAPSAEGPSASSSSSAGGAAASACEQFEACPLIFEGLKRFMEGQWKEWKEESRHCGSRQGPRDAGPGSRAAEEGADWYLRPQKLLWILARLRSSGVLTGNMVASLVVLWLPKLLAAVSERAAEVDEGCRQLLPRLRERGVLEDALACVKACPGLRACEGPIAALLAGEEAASASEALLALLTALDTLRFERRAAFVAELFASLEDRIGEVLDEFDARCPPWMKGAELNHRFITCDGCGATPLRGVRFKCQACPNYDLCGECFPRRRSLHGGDCAEHDFACIVVDWLCKFKGGSPLEQLMKAVKGKGLWQKGWGKGCPPLNMALWKGKGKGKGCKAPARAEEVGTHSSQRSGGGGGGGGLAEFDLSFPVEVEDGRRLTIQWNVGDDPAQVASTFSWQHGILPFEVPAIVRFVRHAEAAALAEREASRPAADPPPTARCRAADEAEEELAAEGPLDEACEQRARGLAEAGLGSVDAMRQLLRSHGGDPAGVLEELAR